MEIGWDLLDRLGPDMSACVFRHLDDPADLIHATAVSRSWNKFVIENGIVKDLCVKLYPEMSYLVLSTQNRGNHNIYAHLIQNLVSKRDMINSCISKCITASSTIDERIENTLESTYINKGLLSNRSSKGEYEDSDKSDKIESLADQLVSDLCMEDEIKKRPWLVTRKNFVKNLCIRIFPDVSYLLSSSQNSEGNHNIYTYLIQNLVSKRDTPISCISKCIAASSTDRFPDECIENTLDDEDFIWGRRSYWSCEGEDEDSGKSETLTYGLVSDLCIVDEIKIRPWVGTIYYGDPIFSSKFVRFKMGCSEISNGPEQIIREGNKGRILNDDNYAWTYISPQFPMRQENELQSFKLPRAVLCMGGIIQIELIGSAQRCNVDNRYYIW
ncbi:hypothetical protein LUZ60_014683 [Juncus effusus]|nr:hypothetical protein LUZ60_014683 [Juncus effusus]